MKVYISRRDNSVKATAEYNHKDGSVEVLKGSKVSEKIAHSTSFRGAKSIERARSNGIVENCILNENVKFKSASSAANFVTGASTNGLIAWKNEDGKTLKEILAEA